jgi:hypothetical protein
VRRKSYVTVQPVARGQGPGGEPAWLPSGPAVRVPCNIYELTAEEVAANEGLQSKVSKKLFVDSWPGSLHAPITTPDGRVWDQYGEEQVFQNGTLTRHIEVRIVSRGGPR